jgi:hypothetical protein
MQPSDINKPRYRKGRFLLDVNETTLDFTPSADRDFPVRRLTQKQTNRLVHHTNNACDEVVEPYCLTSESAVLNMGLSDDTVFCLEYIESDWQTIQYHRSTRKYRKLLEVQYIGADMDLRGGSYMLKRETGRITRSNFEMDVFRELQSTNLVPFVYAHTVKDDTTVTVFEFIDYDLDTAKNMLMTELQELDIDADKTRLEAYAFRILQDRVCATTHRLVELGFLRTDISMHNIRYDTLLQPVFTSLTDVIRKTDVSPAKWQLLKHSALRRTCSRSTWLTMPDTISTNTRDTIVGSIQLESTVSIMQGGVVVVRVRDMSVPNTLENRVTVSIKSDYRRWRTPIRNSLYAYPLYRINQVHVGNKVTRPTSLECVRIGLRKAIEVYEHSIDDGEVFDEWEGIWASEGDGVDFWLMGALEQQHEPIFHIIGDRTPRVIVARMRDLKHIVHGSQ